MSEIAKQHFTLILDNIEPFSINKAYYKKSFTRTVACRKWGEKVSIELENTQNQKEILNFRNNFDENKHYLSIEIVHYIKSSKFFTKKGTVNKNSQDLTNIEKMLVDILMDERHFKRGLSNLNINDALICDLISKKRPCKKPKIVVKFSIKDLNDLGELKNDRTDRKSQRNTRSNTE